MQDNANKPCGDIKDDEGGLRGLGGFIILEPILNVGWQRMRFDVRPLYCSIFVGNCVLWRGLILISLTTIAVQFIF